VKLRILLFVAGTVAGVGALVCWLQWINRPAPIRDIFDEVAAGSHETVWVEMPPPPKGFVADGPSAGKRILFHHHGCPILGTPQFPVARESLIGTGFDYYPCDRCFPFEESRKWAFSSALSMTLAAVVALGLGIVASRRWRCPSCGSRRVCAFCARCGAPFTSGAKHAARLRRSETIAPTGSRIHTPKLAHPEGVADFVMEVREGGNGKL